MSLLKKSIQRHFSFTIPAAKKLREVMKLSIVEKEPSPVIQEIWKKHHANKEFHLASSLTGTQYLNLRKNLQDAPMFIYPVKRGNGHFMLLGQSQDNMMLMTFLDEFKKKGTLSAPTLLFVFFEELLKKKDLCLVRGDLVDGYLNHTEADEIFQQLIMFYMTPELYNGFVLPFNRDPNGFDYSEYTKVMNLSKF